MEINLICHLLSFTDMLPCRRSEECKWLFMYSLVRDITSVFQLDFGIFRTIASFIKISSGQSLIIKLIIINFFRIIWEIDGQMSRDRCLAESLHSMINHCDRHITLLSDTDIQNVSFRLFNLFTYVDLPFGW
jgi:hypothetical protein